MDSAPKPAESITLFYEYVDSSFLSKKLKPSIEAIASKYDKWFDIDIKTVKAGTVKKKGSGSRYDLSGVKIDITSKALDNRFFDYLEAGEAEILKHSLTEEAAHNTKDFLDMIETSFGLKKIGSTDVTPVKELEKEYIQTYGRWLWLYSLESAIITCLSLAVTPELAILYSLIWPTYAWNNNSYNTYWIIQNEETVKLKNESKDNASDAEIIERFKKAYPKQAPSEYTMREIFSIAGMI